MTGPPARGVRVPYQDLPVVVRRWVESVVGAPVVRAATQPGGFSPGVAARLVAADGSRAFVKAVSYAVNADSVALHRQEARVTAALPASAPVPRLLAWYDDGAWVALVFADIAGRPPRLPWRLDELSLVIDALAALPAALTPSPIADLPAVSERLDTRFRGWRELAGSGTPPLASPRRRAGTWSD